jgi:integrase
MPRKTAHEKPKNGEPRLARVRATSFWEIRWGEWMDASGGRSFYRTHRRSTRTHDIDIARAILAKFVGERRVSLYPVAAGAQGTCGDVLVRYASNLQILGAHTTASQTALKLAKHWGSIRVADITRREVASFKEARVIGAGIAPATLNKELRILRAALNWGRREELYDCRIPVIEDAPAAPPRPTFLTEALEAEMWKECAALVNDRTHWRAARFTMIGLDTGARKAAIEGLRWGDIDMAHGSIDFRDEEISERAKKRIVAPLTVRLRDAMKTWGRPISVDAGVVGTRGSHIAPVFPRLMKHLGFEDVTPHTLRHTRITLLLRAGVDPWDVSRIVGLSVKVLLGVYGHAILDDRLRDLANAKYVGRS